MSPMHPAISVKQSKATTSPDKPTADQQFFINILASSSADLDKKLKRMRDIDPKMKDHLERVGQASHNQGSEIKVLSELSSNLKLRIVGENDQHSC